MPDPVVHITLDFVHTLCRRIVGELATAGDTYTTDPVRATSYRVKGCQECIDALDSPRNYLDLINASEKAYQQGYMEGKDRAYFEMQNWQPSAHESGCTCESCRTARFIMSKMLGGVDDVGQAQ